MKSFSHILIISALIVAVPWSADGREIKRDYHESFDVGRDTVLRLNHGDGNVTIRSWDKDILDIEIHYRAEHKSLGKSSCSFRVEFKESKNVIEVTERRNEGICFGFQIHNLEEYTYTIHAPDYIALDLDGDDGDVDIEDWKGTVECSLDDGNVSLNGLQSKKTRISIEDGECDIINHRGNLIISGDDAEIYITGGTIPRCSVELEDGTIRVRDCEGDLDLELDDGEVDLYRLLTGRLDLTMNDGNCDIELLKTDMLEMDIRTDDADVVVSLDSDISASFTIDVDDGKIDVDLSTAEKIQKGRNWMSGRLLDGKGKIRIRTQDGDVTLREIR